MTPLTNLEARVQSYLGQLGLEEAFRPNGVTVLDAGDAPLLVSCFEADGSAWCRIAAVVLTEVAPTVAWLHHVLQSQHDLLIGAFQLFEDGTLALSATLQGHHTDAESFERALTYVAHAAASYAEEFAELAPGTSWPATRQETPA